MSRVVFLVEEYSMKLFLDGLLPRLRPDLAFLCVPHEGKQDLEQSIPRKLKAWQEPGVRFCVIRDNDGGDCAAIKERIAGHCAEGGRPDTVVRIACQELEAWYFGEPAALAAAYGEQHLRSLASKARFRDPDAISQPSRALAAVVPEFQKTSGARRMGRHVSRCNRSRSFQVLLESLDEFAREVFPTEGGA